MSNVHVNVGNDAPRTTEARLVTVGQAAEMLGIGRSKAYELVLTGELELVHIGRCARVPVGSIGDYVDRLRGRAGEDY